MISQWIDFTPQFSGLKAGFKTDYAEVTIYGSRNMGHGNMSDAFKDMMTKNYLLDSESTLQISTHEFFDTLTAYANVIMPGMAKTDLIAFWDSQANYDKLTWEERLIEHAWLVDLGPMLSEPAIRFEGMAGECFWGCACWVVVSYDQLRGTVPPPPNRKVIVEEGIAKMATTVVATPGGAAPKRVRTAMAAPEMAS